MVFFELRWNYSPLKEKAVLLPDGLFVILVASRQTAKDLYRRRTQSAPDASRSARRPPRDVSFCCSAPHPYKVFRIGIVLLHLIQALGAQVGLATFLCVAPLPTASGRSSF
jgi:hypothetical protein